jgi:hypothetical protein
VLWSVLAYTKESVSIPWEGLTQTFRRGRSSIHYEVKGGKSTDSKLEKMGVEEKELLRAARQGSALFNIDRQLSFSAAIQLSSTPSRFS